MMQPMNLGTTMAAGTSYGQPYVQQGGSMSIAPGIQTQAAPRTVGAPPPSMSYAQPSYGTTTMMGAPPPQMYAAPQMQSPRGFGTGTYGTGNYGGSISAMPGIQMGGSVNVAPGGMQQSLSWAPPPQVQMPMQGQMQGSPSVPALQAANVPAWSSAPQAQGYGGGGGGMQGAGGAMFGGAPGVPTDSVQSLRGVEVSTQGLPTPTQISAQQTQYATALDRQLVEGIAVLEKERELEKQMLKFTAEKDVALFTNTIMERFVEQAELVDERCTFQVLELKKAACERKLQLNAQANGLILDYEMKAVQVEWKQKWQVFEQTYNRAEGVLEAEYAKQVAIANTGTAYAAPMPVLR